MNLPGLLFLFVLYTLVVAAIVVGVVYVTGRNRRTTERGLPIPNISGLNIKPRADRTVASWPTRDLLVRPAPPVAEEEFEAVIVSPVLTAGAEPADSSVPAAARATGLSPADEEPTARRTVEPLPASENGRVRHMEFARRPVGAVPEPPAASPERLETVPLEIEPTSQTLDVSEAVPENEPEAALESTPVAEPVVEIAPAVESVSVPVALVVAGQAVGPHATAAADVTAAPPAAPSLQPTPVLEATPAAKPAPAPEPQPVPVAQKAPEPQRAAKPQPAPGAPNPDAGSLAGAFAPGGPLLPEGLRTLEVTPSRTIEPGTTVAATFTLRNPGGGVASGFRVRFCLPAGLAYAAGTARIDGSTLDEQDGQTALLQPAGADLGDIPAGGERRVSLAFTVASLIENGTPIALQAAIAAAGIPVIGSNVVRLIVRSRPVLQNPNTTLSLVAVGTALPGEELALTAQVHNSGQSSAHDLMVLLPLPPHTTFLPRSVTIDGRAPGGESQSVPFGFARPTVIAPVLAPGATISIGYRVRIDTPLEDATPIAAHGAVCAQEVAEFSLPPVVVAISSAASFDGDETSFRVECADEVEPGERVRILLHAKNIGTAAARGLALSIGLPQGMAYTAGSLAIDGAFAPDRGSVPEAIKLGDLAPGRSIDVALTAIVQSPLPDGFRLRPTASVVWSKGERTFERQVIARSAPRFPADFNKIERETPQRVSPGDVVAYTISVANMGTDVATRARLQLTADAELQQLRVSDGETVLSLSDDRTVDLDTLEPGVSRLLRVDGRVAGVVEDQKQLRLSAALLTGQGTRTELGAQVHVVESLPKFTLATSYIALESTPALRFKRASTCRLTLVNEGTDSARGVRVALLMPDELRLEGVDRATRDGNSIVFGDIPAGETREAVLYVRLVGIIAGGDAVTIAARIGGANVVPLGLTSIELATHAEASFAEGATLTSTPSAAVDAGAELVYTLALRNSGDGPAKHLTARIATLTNAVYAQGSTTVNGIALADHSGTSLLLSDTGLLLADVGAGVDVVMSWRAIVNIPLPPATMIESSATVRWDSAPEIAVVAPPVEVRSTSALPIIDPELPFSVLGAIAARTDPR